MKSVPLSRGVFLLIVGVLSLGSIPGQAADDTVVAVLSMRSGPYEQAFEGFQQALGHTVPSFALSEGNVKISPTTRVVIALGGKAALYPYPPNIFLIYGLAPGTKIKPDAHPGGLLKIHTNPSVYLTLSKFKELQPSLKRIAVLWSGDSIQDYIDQKNEMVTRLNIELVSDRITNPDDLPNHLRTLQGKVDALWMPPDAAMVTPTNFKTIKDFAAASGIPFYVPAESLVEQGATASVSCSFTEIGELAGKMTHDFLDGYLKVAFVFPNNSRLVVSTRSASTLHLKIPPDAKSVGEVIP